MPFEPDATHDPNLKSWVESANDAGTDFPIQNLPYGVFCLNGEDPWDDARPGVAIGDKILDLQVCAEAGLFDGLDTEDEPILYEFGTIGLNGLMLASPERRRRVRARISELLSESCPELKDNADVRDEAIVPMDAAQMLMPAEIADYTDFYASVHHATNVGSMFRPTNPLLPNYKYVPIGYHGRASSIVVSGAEVRRPSGQTRPSDDEPPVFGPCKLLDYELEVGFFIGPGNEIGEPIGIDKAGEHLFGMCLVNDWSARDMQKWEYQPLGPFLAKSFTTTISPWVVTGDALAPFRCASYERPSGDPAPLAHLYDNDDQQAGGVDLTLEVLLSSAKMREAGMEPVSLSKGNFKNMYWTIAQMIAHHSSNGCNLQAGDLMASGTISGPERSSRGCLLELTWDGPGEPGADPVPGTQRTPIRLPTGEERKFLADGDEVIIRGWCERDGFRRIGFGECRGIVTPAV